MKAIVQSVLGMYLIITGIRSCAQATDLHGSRLDQTLHSLHFGQSSKERMLRILRFQDFFKELEFQIDVERRSRQPRRDSYAWAISEPSIRELRMGNESLRGLENQMRNWSLQSQLDSRTCSSVGVIDPLEIAMMAQDVKICRLKNVIKEHSNVITLLHGKNLGLMEEVHEVQGVLDDSLLEYSDSDNTSVLPL